MRRLYRKIYLAILGSLLLVVVIAGAVWQFGAGRPAEEVFRLAGDIALAALPSADAPPADQQAAIAALGQRLGADMALYDPARRLVAAAGEPLPAPSRRSEGGWSYGHGRPAWTFALADGRWLVVGVGAGHRNPVLGLIVFLGIVAVAVGIAAYPVARGLTRRLERLQTGVETLGAGDLAARVKVEGRDEVARLAESFNHAAARIEELVGANRLMLANASHELRTPLSRIRLGLDLFETRPEPKLKAALMADIAELDRLIDEILLASRLDASPTLSTVEDVDLQAVCAEECARFADCELSGDPVSLRGDPHLLHRLVRNLLDNADRHGRPPVKVVLKREGAKASLAVLDHGDGVPESQREKVFAPFYRLAGERAGTGLGLSLVRQIARLHGGDVAVWRDPALALNGFRVTLPANG